MTLGTWICTECKHRIEEILISSVVSECPKCKAKYRKVRTLKAHVEHLIVVTKSPTGKENVIMPIFFAFNEDKLEDVHEYFRILEEINKEPSPTYLI